MAEPTTDDLRGKGNDLYKAGKLEEGMAMSQVQQMMLMRSSDQAILSGIRTSSARCKTIVKSVRRVF